MCGPNSQDCHFWTSDLAYFSEKYAYKLNQVKPQFTEEIQKILR